MELKGKAERTMRLVSRFIAGIHSMELKE